MKNLFNNISQEEKNRILEMHSGKKNVIREDVNSNEMYNKAGHFNKSYKNIRHLNEKIPIKKQYSL